MPEILDKIVSRLTYSLGITVFSMSIVFTVLIVLMFVIRFQAYIFSFIGGRTSKKAEAEKKNSKTTIKTEMVKTETINNQEAKSMHTNNEEIAAVIVAAICAYTNQPESNFKINSIKRVSGNDSSWRKAGMLS